MTQGLNVSRLVNVQTVLSPLSATTNGYGTLLILGDSTVIDPVSRLRSYTDIAGVASDFGTNAPEYKAALLYFGQSPAPSKLMIGRWLRTPSSGYLNGGALTATEQLMTNWTTITAGTFTIDIDGTPQSPASLDFSGETNLNGVASVITAALTGATCTWTGTKFVITSTSTGVTSTVGYATSGIAAQLKLVTGVASVPVDGMVAESPLECVTLMDNLSGQWYGLAFAASTMPATNDYLDVAGYIEADSQAHIFGITTSDPNTLEATVTNDLASQLKALLYKNTFIQYCSANPYACVSLMGRAFSVNFAANRSTITLMYKQEPGVIAEYLTETQAQTLQAKRCNVYVNYQNDTMIIQYGVMSGQAYFDEIHGLDWFAGTLQNALYNLLYTSTTKIPQTDAGQNQLVNVCNSVCEQAVNNGLVAPGTWNAGGFGQLQTGDFLKSGFYIYTPPMATQDQATREQRIAPPIQIALKLAGAIHQVSAIINVNR